MCLYKAFVWHIWDIVIKLCLYGGYIYIYMCYGCWSINKGTYKGWLYNKGIYNSGQHIGGVYIAWVYKGRIYKVAAYKVAACTNGLYKAMDI